MASTPFRSPMVSGLPYYVWEVPDKKISIQLHFDVIDRMSPEILRGFGALKRRGAEVGGILLGRWEDGPVRKVIVEDFEAVPSEYLTGPSYSLSPNDLVSFEAALARHSGSAAPISVVGFYRSHTRDDLFMDRADLEIAHRYFQSPENVFLVVKPSATRPSVAGFFFWEDGGEINRESSYQVFPFLRQELGGGAPQPGPRRPEPDGRLPSTGRPAESEPAGSADRLQPAPGFPALSILRAAELPTRVASPSRLRLLALPALVLAILAGGFFAYSSLNPPPAPVEVPLPLNLAVADKSGQLDVTWNRDSSSIVTAQRGVLSIADGSTKKDLELSGPQLRNGRVLYARLSGDVSIRLEVFPAGRSSVVESVRIMLLEAPHESAPATPPPPDPEISRAKKKKVWTRPAAQTTPPASAARTAPTPAKPAAPVAEAPPPEVELQRPARRR